MASEDMALDRRELDKKRFRFDATIGWVHVLTTLAMAASVFVWAMKMDSRVTVTETKTAQLEKENERQDRESSLNYQRILDELREINRKIDGRR